MSDYNRVLEQIRKSGQMWVDSETALQMLDNEPVHAVQKEHGRVLLKWDPEPTLPPEDNRGQIPEFEEDDYDAWLDNMERRDADYYNSGENWRGE